ncbi:MAG: phosphatidylglycerol lysyltransferase [Spirochaetaceae bacterium]|jgi:phosphoglucomutase|nr:phosphatidylglycerol lysyltransferase [Spirochaetaceae bacterium]
MQTILDSMLLSASGWRGVFSKDGECAEAEISAAHNMIVRAAASAFVCFLREKTGCSAPLLICGMDSRPTGEAIAGAVLNELKNEDCEVFWTGIAASPEIMSYARAMGNAGRQGGFFYISASHNPIGYNGIKFGFLDGGVLDANNEALLRGRFKQMLKTLPEESQSGAAGESLKNQNQIIPDGIKLYYKKNDALNEYKAFIYRVIAGDGIDAAGLKSVLQEALARRPLGVVCDFNGSARAASIDRDFFNEFGIKFNAINDTAGKIAHRIVPEGESLIPCCRALEKAHSADAAFCTGYVPDCDGDRGNLVIWDDELKAARPLEAQEVFALACLAELLHLRWTGVLKNTKVAIATNDATSMRVDRLAANFGAKVFRAEVGEANVVALAGRLRKEGWTVRALGEGAAGGVIMFPSSVRDPLCSVMAIVKMLTLKGFFTEASNPTLAGIIKSLPEFISTGVYEREALLTINCSCHEKLKRHYQRIFCAQWKEKQSDFCEMGIVSWQAFCYNGTEERCCNDDFGLAGRGGLKINFCDEQGTSRAALWMRGSATEPVFRIMADVECDFFRKIHIQNKKTDGRPANTTANLDDIPRLIERKLIAWQRDMVTSADAEALCS